MPHLFLNLGSELGAPERRQPVVISTMLTWVYLAAAICTASAFLRYQGAIPNGDIVPDPCRIGDWPGVGHFSSNGAGPRNEFGLDFAAAGHVWTQSLCQKDSDRDGRTNGQELGDPTCRWTPTSTISLAAPTTHPGICEPIGSSACAWQAFLC
ncbi:unnamed protein product [Lymnaea stagnalis]|uniref:Temptin Cys/Cys disulfide domain-containing protein n=1 Tax=Lymnaea stagnalis TaxID=6523 RepID=A0AAV2HJC8_LYMST